MVSCTAAGGFATELQNAGVGGLKTRKERLLLLTKSKQNN
jgi:hypothetical protein